MIVKGGSCQTMVGSVKGTFIPLLSVSPLVGKGFGVVIISTHASTIISQLLWTSNLREKGSETCLAQYF